MLFFILITITVIFISYVAYTNYYQYKLTSLYLIFPVSKHKGPNALATSIKSMIRNNTNELKKMCHIYIKESISLKDLRYLSHLKGTLIWFQWSNYFKHILMDKSIDFSHVLYGPNVTPLLWMNYPYPDSYEMKWKEYLSKIFGYVSHYPRVRDHIMKKSKTEIYKEKYLFFRTCSNVNPPSETIKSWDEREYDFLIFIKYEDLNNKENGNKLINKLKRYKNVILEYGKYEYSELLKYAPECRCVIYYSFYDTGAIALQEIQNFGVYAIVLQKEFVDNKTGVFVPELEYNDIERAVTRCEEIIREKRDSKFLAKYNMEKNSCLHSFLSLFNQISNLMKRNNI